MEINGTIYRMIALGLMTDNFIIQISDLIVLIDADVSEGENVLSIVDATPLKGCLSIIAILMAFGGL